MLSSLALTLYLAWFHFSEAGPGHLSDTSSAIRRLLLWMVSSSQEDLDNNSLLSSSTAYFWSSSRLHCQGSLDMDELIPL